MGLIQIATPFNIDLEFEIADFYKRLLAYLMDFALLILYLLSMKYLYYGGIGRVSSDELQSHVGIDILTISMPMLLYSLVCEVLMHGQTPGKKIMNIRVISLSGGEPQLSQYLLRWMFKAFEWPFFFGYVLLTSETLIVYIVITGFLGVAVIIFIAVAKKNQRLGDIAANTVVVNTKSAFSVEDTVFMDIKPTDYIVSFPEVLQLSDRDINTIKNVASMYYKSHNRHTVLRVSYKIQEVLHLTTDMEPLDFMEKLLADYNYLATK